MNRSTMGAAGPIAEIMRVHPQQSFLEKEQLVQVLRALNECASTCIACANACLAEEHVKQLSRCIRLNQDCADICTTSTRVLARVAMPEPTVMRHLLMACAAACAACSEECARHAGMHEHCRVCAESSRACETECRAALERL